MRRKMLLLLVQTLGLAGLAVFTTFHSIEPVQASCTNGCTVRSQGPQECAPPAKGGGDEFGCTIQSSTCAWGNYCGSM